MKDEGLRVVGSSKNQVCRTSSQAGENKQTKLGGGLNLSSCNLEVLYYLNFSIQLTAVLKIGQIGHGQTVRALVQLAHDKEPFAQNMEVFSFVQPPFQSRKMIQVYWMVILNHAEKSMDGELIVSNSRYSCPKLVLYAFKHKRQINIIDTRRVVIFIKIVLTLLFELFQIKNQIVTLVQPMERVHPSVEKVSCP